MFLVETDYPKAIRIEALNQQLDGTTVEEIEKDAKVEMETYLRVKFNTTAIFSAVGENRHRDIVRIMIDLVLYYVSLRISPKQVQETRLTQYNKGIKWLKEVRDGDLTPDLPKYMTEDNETKPSSFRFTSKQPPHDMFF
ncbi:hypothetical protein AD998_02070 [bacterium 336/3]|nr:hypothetical protein AD998_02070 [bacterium 336/3]